MRYLTAFAAVLGLLLSGDPAAAGGKVATVKRCGTVITASGSYALKGNLIGEVGTDASNCVTVDADNVTLDLAGYNINCQSNGFHGVAVPDGRDGVTIRNGSIARCVEGVAAGGATGLLVHEVLALSNTSHGIRVGQKSTVTRNISYDNVGYGVMVWCPVNVIQNVSVENYQGFYFAGSGCNAQHNVGQ